VENSPQNICGYTKTFYSVVSCIKWITYFALLLELRPDREFRFNKLFKILFLKRNSNAEITFSHFYTRFCCHFKCNNWKVLTRCRTDRFRVKKTWLPWITHLLKCIHIIHHFVTCMRSRIKEMLAFATVKIIVGPWLSNSVSKWTQMSRSKVVQSKS